MVLYCKVILILYVIAVCGPGLEVTNALEMGPLHKKVVSHLEMLIKDPDLDLLPSASPKSATLNGCKRWNRPNAVAAIHRLAPTLPDLREILVAFFKGARKTWIQFSAKFEDDGVIAGLTNEEKKLYLMPATNDANEGVLGEYRLFARRFPTRCQDAQDDIINQDTGRDIIKPGVSDQQIKERVQCQMA